MKILVLKNSPIDITTNLSEATAFFFKHNIKLEFEIQTVNIPVSVSKYSEKQGFSPITGKPSKIWYYGLSDYVQVNIRNKVKENLYDIVIFAWDIDTIVAVDGKLSTKDNDPKIICNAVKEVNDDLITILKAKFSESSSLTTLPV